ncbi:MAG: YidC/Oxa1 family membrane protein insertase [Bacilli bacterium]|nr:YidC/Oxa1 family membrane protein insertase [Bacilli bacterium]
MKKQTRKYLVVVVVLVLLLVLSGCGRSREDMTPIQGWTGLLDILVWPMAALMYATGKFIGFGYYGIAIIISTLIVRTLAWPIYAKTNDLSLKMQLMGPEQAKLEAKYAGKTDQESMQRKQMEMMQLYKKHGVGFGGCLLPLVQFPIFIAFYETLQRIPLTVSEEFTFNFGEFSTRFLGIDLFLGRTEAGTYQTWGVIILAAVVGITQIISQFLMQQRQKKAKAEQQSNVPAYRQPQPTDVQKQTEMTMKFMMYGMSIMMMVFVYNSTAALGLYWLVGNLYTTLQGYIGHKRSKSRMEKLKAKM